MTSVAKNQTALDVGMDEMVRISHIRHLHPIYFVSRQNWVGLIGRPHIICQMNSA